MGGRPALDLGCSAASNVVEAEPLKGLTAFLTEKLCVSWCSENVSLGRCVSKFEVRSFELSLTFSSWLAPHLAERITVIGRGTSVANCCPTPF